VIRGIYIALFFLFLGTNSASAQEELRIDNLKVQDTVKKNSISLRLPKPPFIRPYCLDWVRLTTKSTGKSQLYMPPLELACMPILGTTKNTTSSEMRTKIASLDFQMIFNFWMMND
jgi:hypothetical protein